MQSYGNNHIAIVIIAQWIIQQRIIWIPSPEAFRNADVTVLTVDPRLLMKNDQEQ